MEKKILNNDKKENDLDELKREMLEIKRKMNI